MAQEPFQNTELSIENRVKDLISRMTLEEKISQMSHLSPAIPRLCVIAYDPNFHNPLGIGSFELDEEEIENFQKLRPWENLEYWEGGCLDGGWWNEALHGVARAGLATAFPQAIGLGSTWDPDLIKKMAAVISDEARIHNKIYGKKLTYWSPTINILRDPRWGRTEESYSEDPYLLSRMAVSFVKGFQGNDKKYLKAIATVKHFVANNSEFNRHTGSSDMPERQLHEYYLPAFKAAIMEGGAFSVMGAYNSLNGIPCCANSWLLTDILRNQWGFQGYVVSDCGAVSDIVHGHSFELDPEKAVAAAVKAGCDLECETCEKEQFMYDKYLLNAVKKGYISEQAIDTAVTRLFRARFKLGEFDTPESVPYTKIPVMQLDSKEHRKLALKIARESMVLLKNENSLLPLDASKIKQVAVIGPNGDVAELGGYSGTPSFTISPLEGIREKFGRQRVDFEIGCGLLESYPGGFERAMQAAANSDVAIVVLGTNLNMANEGLDRKKLGLPDVQIQLLKEVYQSNPNTILVLINGNPLSIRWAKENIPAIIEAWYPGQSGGTAIADVLFGGYNPGGRMPVTVYKSAEQLPPIDDYDITKGRTYWYFKGEVLYPFGHGLSYTTFEYCDLKIKKKIYFKKEDKLKVQFYVKNVGNVGGDEVVQLYIRNVKSKYNHPNQKLRRFKRLYIGAGEKALIIFKLDENDFSYWDPVKKEWAVEKGEFEIMVGSSSKDMRQQKNIFVEE